MPFLGESQMVIPEGAVGGAGRKGGRDMVEGGICFFTFIFVGFFQIKFDLLFSHLSLSDFSGEVLLTFIFV